MTRNFLNVGTAIEAFGLRRISRNIIKIHIQKFINLVSPAQIALSIFLVILMRQNMYATMPQLYLKKPRSWRRNWRMMPKQQRRMPRKSLEKKSDGALEVISIYALLEAWIRDRLDRARASGEEPPPDQLPDQLLAKGRVVTEENLHALLGFSNSSLGVTRSLSHWVLYRWYNCQIVHCKGFGLFSSHALEMSRQLKA